MRIFSVDMTLRGFLAIFCSYDYGANASEAVEKIATDEKIIANAPWAA